MGLQSLGSAVYCNTGILQASGDGGKQGPFRRLIGILKKPTRRPPRIIDSETGDTEPGKDISMEFRVHDISHCLV